MGRGPGSTIAVVPARRPAGLALSARPANTASGRLVSVTSSWSVFASWFTPPLLAQGCEVVATATDIALLTLGQALVVRMGVTTLLAAIMV